MDFSKIKNFVINLREQPEEQRKNIFFVVMSIFAVIIAVFAIISLKTGLSKIGESVKSVPSFDKQNYELQEEIPQDALITEPENNVNNGSDTLDRETSGFE